MNKAELIRHEIEKRRVHNLAIGNPLFSAMAEEDIELLCFIDSLQEEPVSEDLEEAAIRASMLKHDIPKEHLHEYLYNDYGMRKFVEGAKWQEEKDNEEKVLTYRHGFNDCKEHIEEVLLSEVLPCFMRGGEADEVVAKLDEVLNQKK